MARQEGIAVVSVLLRGIPYAAAWARRGLPAALFRSEFTHLVAAAAKHAGGDLVRPLLAAQA